MMHMETVRVTRHERLFADYWNIAFSSTIIGPQVQPGQFVHLKVPRLEDAVLRRPFSVFRADEESLALLYKPVGLGTRALTAVRTGDEISLIGPLGTGFPQNPAGTRPAFVAGGYGMAAFYLLAAQAVRPGNVFVGGRTSDDILLREEFEALGWTVHVTTEDGSAGRRGLVTESLDAWFEDDGGGDDVVLYGCGPNPMLKAVGDRALARGLPCWLSMDRHMGCGVGACLTCVQKVRNGDDGWKWARVCREGPVFECRELVWN